MVVRIKPGQYLQPLAVEIWPICAATLLYTCCTFAVHQRCAKPMTDKERLTVRISPTLLYALRNRSKNTGASQAELVEKALSAQLGIDIGGGPDISARVRELELWQSEVEMKLNFLRDRTEPQTPPKVKKGFGR